MEAATRAMPVRPRRGEATRHAARRGASRGPGPDDCSCQLEIVVPVYNEADGLESGITTLRRYLDDSFPFRTLITIADNGSTDDTALIAQRLAATLEGVEVLVLSRKGRGFALRSAWTASQAEVVAYLDVDLSTSLAALLPLVGSVFSGYSDIAIGTRLVHGSRVVRGPKRELISRAYSHIVRLSLRSRVSDFQCGFKAIRRSRALELLPLVHDDEWFFDTELLVTAERLGVRISETPVEWVDDPASSVDIVATAAQDLRGIWRVARSRNRGGGRDGAYDRARRAGAAGPTRNSTPAPTAPVTADQLLSFAGVGILSTLGYLLLFALCWGALGPWGANAAALAVCTLANTAWHHSLAREAPATSVARAVRGAGPTLTSVVAVLFGVSLVATTAAIAVATLVAGSRFAGDALAALVGSCTASLLRFSLLRGWVFRPVHAPVDLAGTGGP
jgi:putative flippase GtrA